MQRQRSAPTVAVGLALLATALTGGSAAAKTILDGAEPSQNEIYIRTDGLACYFCAYGLERFFRNTGRIAAFDIDMKKGVVEVVPRRGEPLVSARLLGQYVHDAGFTPRGFRVALTGRFVRTGEELEFEVAETGERLPVRAAAEAAAAGDLGRPVRVQARGLEHEEAAFELEDLSYERVGADGAREES